MPRLMLFLLLGVLLPVLGTEVALAQRCSQSTDSPNDVMQIRSTRGRPGDTILVPVNVQNDSIFTGFRFIIQFDTTKVRAVPDNNDPIFRKVIAAGRLAASRAIPPPANDTFGIPFFCNTYQGERNALSVFLSSSFSNRADTIRPGSGDIFLIPFVIQPGLQHLVDTAVFTFVRRDLVGSIDTIGGLPDTNFICDRSNLSSVWNTGIEFINPPVYPRTFNGRMILVVDTTPPRAQISFSANPLTVAANAASTLSWTVTNADSMYINQNDVRLGSFVYPLTGSSQVIPSAAVPASDPVAYNLIAFKGALVDTAVVLVDIEGGGPNPTAPSITFTPNQSVYSVNPGQTVSFNVRATNPPAGGGNITLSPGSLPTNATFGPTNPVIGASPVNGTFSFTPSTAQQNQNFTITFSAANSAASANASVTINVTQLPIDRLFTTSAVGQSPVGGLRGTPGILFPINMVTTKTVYGIQFDMAYPQNQFTLDSISVTDRIPDYIVYDNIGQTPGRVRVLTFGLNNEPVVNGSSTVVLNAAFSIDSSAVCTDDYPIIIDSGFESFDPNPNAPADTFKTDDGIIQVDCPGDVNLDRDVNVGDVVNIVGSIINAFTLNPRQFAAADIVISNSVNVFDLVADIDLIFNGSIQPGPPQPSPALPSTMTLAHGEIPVGDQGMLMITSDLSTEVAGVQLELSYDPTSVILGRPEVNVDPSIRRNFVLQYRDNGNGRMKMVLYTSQIYSPHEQLQEGFANLIKVPMTAKKNIKADDRSKIRLSDAMLSTGGALSVSVTGTEPPLPTSFALKQNYPNPFNPTTTIEFSVDADQGSEDVSLEIFNILGQQVKTLVNENLPAGDYRYEWNATDEAGLRVATGVYLYRLSVGDKRESKKMLFLK